MVLTLLLRDAKQIWNSHVAECDICKAASRIFCGPIWSLQAMWFQIGRWTVSGEVAMGQTFVYIYWRNNNTEKIKNNNSLNNYRTFPGTVFSLDTGKQAKKKSITIHLFKGCCDRFSKLNHDLCQRNAFGAYDMFLIMSLKFTRLFSLMKIKCIVKGQKWQFSHPNTWLSWQQGL